MCPADGVVVAVAATGVCRSDWHAWRGHEQVALPHVPGHEYAGTVVAVGPDVASRVVGDRVTVPFVLGCGRCEMCRTGNAQVCPDQEQRGQMTIYDAAGRAQRYPDLLPSSVYLPMR